MRKAKEADIAAKSEPQKPNKAKLAQQRSRTTQRKVIKAAIKLWNERGFDTAFEATTVDEIAERAGVSRATVYYYFPKKEDILREMAWITADEIYECALRSMMNRRSVDEVLGDVVDALGTKIMRGSSPAIKRMLQLRNVDASELDRDAANGGLTRAFSVVITHAQEAGELPRTLGALEIAQMVTSLCMGSIWKWSVTEDFDLLQSLQLRTAILLTGVRGYAFPGD